MTEPLRLSLFPLCFRPFTSLITRLWKRLHFLMWMTPKTIYRSEPYGHPEASGRKVDKFEASHFPPPPDDGI